MKYQSIEEVEKLKEFKYTCYYCGKEITYKNVKGLIKKFRSWNHDDELMLSFFNEPEYNLCAKCARD